MFTCLTTTQQRQVKSPRDPGVVSLHVNAGHFSTTTRRVTSPTWGPPPPCKQALKRHQLELIRSNKKLCFYSIFKTDVSKFHYLEQVKNLKHRRAVAKLRSGNHNLRIESGRHCVRT